MYSAENTVVLLQVIKHYPGLIGCVVLTAQIQTVEPCYP